MKISEAEEIFGKPFENWDYIERKEFAYCISATELNDKRIWVCAMLNPTRVKPEVAHKLSSWFDNLEDLSGRSPTFIGKLLDITIFAEETSND